MEGMFTKQKMRMKLFVRIIGRAHPMVKIDLACNTNRLVRLDRQATA